MSQKWVDNLFRRILVTPVCWYWLGAFTHDGYARTRKGYTHARVHRETYKLLRGDIPANLVTDHLCRNRGCVNPYHLELVTTKENILRSPVAFSAINARKTSCKRGHEFTEENTYSYPHMHGRRGCRMCKRSNELINYRKKTLATTAAL